MTTPFTGMMMCLAALSTFSIAMASSSGPRLQSRSNQAQASARVAEDRLAALKEHRQSSMILNVPDVEHHMIICNAYASSHKLEIVRVSTKEVLTEGEPLAYKQCQDFTVAFQEGEQLDFKANGLDVGTFHATGLPKSPSSLLLVPHRRSTSAVGCTFESHAFADVQSPQVAIIDAFRGKNGKQTGSIKIIEALTDSGDKSQAPPRVEEELKFDSVIAVNPGKYDIALAGTDGPTISAPLNAAGTSKYVIVRLGIQDEAQIHRYPQELVVFPNRATHLSVTMAALAVAFFCLRELV